MQPTPSSSGGSGGELNRSGLGLARFRSAPASWLEALLEEGEEGEEDDPLKPNQTLTQLLSSTAPPTKNSVLLSSSSTEFLEPVEFQRQNSSPADFLVSSGVGSDGYFSSYGIPSNYDCMSPNMDASTSSNKRARDVELHNASSSAKYSPQLKVEQSGQSPGGMSSLIEMEMEKIMEDSVPCRVRAKRGCATHPRSIAERVRRTRISDRIRKLQELVPNMDKQTNTADMLDEAVEYVKFLQRQIQEIVGFAIDVVKHDRNSQNIKGNAHASPKNNTSKIHHMRDCTSAHVDREVNTSIKLMLKAYCFIRKNSSLKFIL